MTVNESLIFMVLLLATLTYIHIFLGIGSNIVSGLVILFFVVMAILREKYGKR